MKFKVGDIVTGTKDNHYGYTNSNAIMEVIDVQDREIRVEILELNQKNKPRNVIDGCEHLIYWVDSRKFRHYNTNQQVISENYDI